jgi:pimeloyl-ACP methyl ester carboxylesterase
LAEEWRGHANDIPDDFGKLFVALSFTWASRKQRRATLVIRGSGAPLLVIHSEFGVAGWLESFARLADHYDVVVPSLPGYGRSTRPDWIMSVHDLAEPQPDRVRVGYASIAEALIQVSGRLISQGTADGGLIPQASMSARASSD